MAISTLGHAVLGLLSAEPMTGYDLTATFDAGLANVWSARHGQIYPELAKLQASGLIEQTAAGPRGSKQYTATAAGRDAVRHWLTETEPSSILRSERMLRIFFLWMLPRDEAAAYLHREAAGHRARLERYLGTAEKIPPDAVPAERWGRIALEAGIRFERTMGEWADWAAAEVESMPRD